MRLYMDEGERDKTEEAFTRLLTTVDDEGNASE
jgi:hypothetical protein